MAVQCRLLFRFAGLLKSSDYADYFAGLGKLQLLLADGSHTDLTIICNNAKDDEKLMERYLAVSAETDEMNAVIAILTGNRIVKTRTQNAYTGVIADITTEIDCNLDGVFDDKDNLDHGLNIGVLTSSCSYSCANGFPMYMKEAGIPILGEQSGGGPCWIEVFATPEGFLYCASSGLVRYVDASGDAHDDGIPVDIDLFMRERDGSVKNITMEVPENPDYPEDGSIKVTMPDYSEFYNIDRLSEEMTKYYE